MMIARVEGQGNAPVVPSARIMCNTQSTVLAPTSTRRGRQGLLEIGECYVNLDHVLFRYELLNGKSSCKRGDMARGPRHTAPLWGIGLGSQI